MAYETPKYNRVSIPQFTLAMRDIKEYNAMDTAHFNFNRDFGNDLSKIIYDVAREVMLESKLNYVPVLTGRLRASGLVGIPNYGGGKDIFVDLSYNTPYAWFIHEHHKSKSKYLEKPFDDAVDSGIMEERIARKILQNMGLQ